MPFVFVALVDAIGQWITADTHQQTQYNLRVLVLSFLGKAGLAQLIFII